MMEHYCSPRGFDFEINGSDEPWNNDNSSKDFNAEDEAKELMKNVDNRAVHYLTDHILMVMGCDFEYMDAHANYRNMDNMISYMNTHYGDKYHFQYSTPSNYVDAVSAVNVTWPTKYDDMFPYADGPDAYWTGYFTSRPDDKD